MKRLPVIAIDGPAASGKGTIARRIAATLGFDHLDTGLLYRGVGMAVIAAGKDPADAVAATAAARGFNPAWLDDPRLRSDVAGPAASKVAAVPAVREALLAFQRRFAISPPAGRGAILDGRDIGTVICPDADVKLFVTASPEVRAARRFRELREAGHSVTEAEVLADIERRDRRDRSRAISPLRQARDAYLLDTTNLAIDAAFKAAIALIDAAMGRAGQAG